MGSNPTVFTRSSLGVLRTRGLVKWLRSTEVVHYLGKIEVGGSIPPGASSIEGFNIAFDVLPMAQVGVRNLHNGYNEI